MEDSLNGFCVVGRIYFYMIRLFVKGLINRVFDDVHHWHDEYHGGKDGWDDCIDQPTQLNDTGFLRLFQNSLTAGSDSSCESLVDNVS